MEFEVRVATAPEVSSLQEQQEVKVRPVELRVFCGVVETDFKFQVIEQSHIVIVRSWWRLRLKSSQALTGQLTGYMTQKERWVC